ncbi:Uncharacterized protein Fot_32671 [Forsythia ovata]|uniref:Uncharacterized protein n=1 Tax=Forsythia ovata TaxID=205694 RepID=A0ABD1T8G8_9LAMI
MFYVQQASKEEGMAHKDKELGVLNKTIEPKGLALAEMAANVEALQKELLNFRDYDEVKQIFEDGNQAGGTELLDLIKDEHPDFNFEFLFEERETDALALLPMNDDTEAAIELAGSKVPEKPTTSEASPLEALPSEAPHSHGTDPTVFENLQ